MHQINPNKLHHSKWTAVTPQHKEKHFIVIKLIYNEENTLTHCRIEAVFSKRQFTIPWQNLKAENSWLQGWK